MKSIIFVTLYLFSSFSFADAIIPEDVLSTWGYKTTEKSQNSQDIKQIKGERWGENQVNYPRFTLSKLCFESFEMAEEKQKETRENQKNDPFKGFKSHYNDFISGKCLYSISTAARVTFLSYQPDVLKKYKTYVQEIKNP